MNDPIAVAVGASGNVYVAERYGFTVRRISASGIITTVAGNGAQTFNGDGIPAVSASIDVRGIAADAAGNLYIADGSNQRVRKVSANGIISTIASNGLSFPSRVAVSRSGVVYVIDGSRVVKVGSNGLLQPVAGTGEYGFSGDDGPAVQAMLANPSSITLDRAGNLYIVDGDERVRRVDVNGKIATVAGGGPFRIDPVARNYRWSFPRAVAVDSRGNFFVAGLNSVVRVVNPDGIADDAAGKVLDQGGMVVGAPFGFSGDGGPAVNALLYEPEGVAIDEQDNLYIADTRNNRIRKVTPVATPRTPSGINAFGAYRTYGVGSYVRHVAIADVTGDGRDDALLTTTTWAPANPDPQKDMRLWLFVQRPDGSLAAPVGYPYPGDLAGGRSGSGLDAGDLNGDGFEDVVMGTLTGITIFLGSPAGLSQGVTYKSQFSGAQVGLSATVMDVDRDGRLDVVTLSGGRSEGGDHPDDRVGLIIYFGNGLGGISRQTFQLRPANVDWTFLRATDVDNDGIQDLTSGWTGIVNGYYRGGVEVTLHNGASGFRPVTRMQPSEAVSWGPAYAVGDFDSDHRKDAVVSYSRNTPDAAYAQFRQGPDGKFFEVGTWFAYDVPDEMISDDMNGDGRDDLLVIHGGWSSIGYYEQNDAGLDVEIKYYTVQTGNPAMPAIATGDLNGDGCKDIAMADRNYGLVVLPGQNCNKRVRINGSQPRIPGTAAPNAMAASAVEPAEVAGRIAGPEDLSDGGRDAAGLPRPAVEIPRARAAWFQRRFFAAISGFLGLVFIIGGLFYFHLARKAI